MRIIIASTGAPAGVAARKEALDAFLTGEGHKTQILDLPPISAPGRTLTNVASLRLMGTESADVLICLDAAASILHHPRKLVWLLDDSYLCADGAGEATYLANVLRAAVEEAAAIFAPSRAALEKLHAVQLDRAKLLSPASKPKKSLPTTPTKPAPSAFAPLLKALVA